MRAVVAEDLALLRDGIVRILTAHGFEVVDAVGSGPLLSDALDRHRPDVAVVDVRLPPSFTDEGLRAVVEARRNIPGLPVLVVSQHVEPLYARELLADGAGAVGYLLKDRVMNVSQFIEAVHRVAGGGTAIDPDVISELVAPRHREDPVHRLTPRESEVLGLMAEGRTNVGIAGRLSVSHKAVSKNINGIFEKLGLQASDDDNRRVLAILAFLEHRTVPGTGPSGHGRV